MTNPTFTPTDIVNFAAAKDAVNISAAFDQLVGQKVVDAIQARKQHVASAMFNDQQPDEVSDDTTVGNEEQAEQETEESDEDAQVPN
jgi:hypothetical protein